MISLQKNDIQWVLPIGLTWRVLLIALTSPISLIWYIYFLQSIFWNLKGVGVADKAIFDVVSR
jgi:hypothetical protein